MIRKFFFYWLKFIYSDINCNNYVCMYTVDDFICECVNLLNIQVIIWNCLFLWLTACQGVGKLQITTTK